VRSSCASPIPAVPTSMNATSGRGRPVSRSRRMTSTPKPSSPRRTLPNPATTMRTSALLHGLAAERQTNVATVDRDGEDPQPFAPIESMTTAKVVPAAVPAAAQLSAVQGAEVQGEGALTALIRHREKFPFDIGEKNSAPLDVDGPHRSGPHIGDRAEPAVHRVLSAAQSADLQQRTIPRGYAIADNELLEAEESGSQGFFEIMTHGFDGDGASLEAVELHIYRASDDLRQLDVDPVIVQVAAHHVESLLGVQTAIHRDQIVGHQQQ